MSRLDKAINAVGIVDLQTDRSVPDCDALHQTGEGAHCGKLAKQNRFARLQACTEHASLDTGRLGNRTIGNRVRRPGTHPKVKRTECLALVKPPQGNKYRSVCRFTLGFKTMLMPAVQPQGTADHQDQTQCAHSENLALHGQTLNAQANAELVELEFERTTQRGDRAHNHKRNQCGNQAILDRTGTKLL